MQKFSFEKIAGKFGVRPLIVRLLEGIEDKNMFWSAYPSSLKDKLGPVNKGSHEANGSWLIF